MLTAFVLMMAGVVSVATPAQANTGDYPYFNATMTSSGTWGYVECKGHCGYFEYLNGTKYYYMSERGYAIRNCTDYVAWKLQSLGATNVSGLGNGGQWAARAQNRAGLTVSTTPSVNAAAVQESTGPEDAGHVAFVQSVHSNGSITVSEYNYGFTGNFHTRTGTPSALGFTKFVNFGVNPPPAPSATQNLTFIKTAGTNGNVEVHWASEANNFASWSGGTSTWFNTNNAANGTFTLHDMNGDGKQDLVYIKTQGTTSGKVELHWVDAANNFAGVPHSYTTWFSTADAANGVFMMGRLDNHPDLVFIKTANTGNGKVELHYVSSNNNYASWIGGTATWFSLADVGNGTFTLHDMDGVNGDDLVFIKTKNTSGNLELHWLNAATGFVLAPASYTTWYNAADAVNGTFGVARLYGTPPGLVFVKKANTSGQIEVHFVSSSNNYTSWANGGASWFSVADAGNGTFLIGAN